MIIINGSKINLDEIKLTDYLNDNRFDTSKIAIEINGSILPKSEYSGAVLKDGDKVEIVSFVGGG